MFSDQSKRQVLGLVFVFIFITSINSFAQSLPVEKDFVVNNAVACEASQNCPPFVGALVHRTDEFLDLEKTMPFMGHCTVTLIGEDQVLTSTHCIPPQIRKVGADCGAWIQISFPELKGTAYQLEDHACGKIVKFVEIGNQNEENKQEWAVIQLRNKSSRPVVDPQQLELPFGTKIHGFTIYYYAFFPVGQLERVTCEVMDLGYLFPQAFHASGAIFTASGCDKNIMVGNSGTGFFDEKENYIGLLSAMITQKFQPGDKVASEGSKVILGSKALCFDAFSIRPKSCDFDANDTEFQKTTILTSSLNAFDKSLKDNKFKSIKQVFSTYILWDRAWPVNLGSTFVDLYHDSTYYDALAYFRTHDSPYLAEQVENQVANILGEVPRCVKNPQGLETFKDQMMYTIFSFSDFTMYPYNDNGDMYFRMLTDKQLSVESARLKLPLTIQKVTNAGATGYVVNFDRAAFKDYDLSVVEKSQEILCRNEGKLKVTACKGDRVCEVAETTSTPSPECQTLYKKIGFSRYLRSFTLRLPGCQ